MAKNTTTTTTTKGERTTTTKARKSARKTGLDLFTKAPEEAPEAPVVETETAETAEAVPVPVETETETETAETVVETAPPVNEGETETGTAEAPVESETEPQGETREGEGAPPVDPSPPVDPLVLALAQASRAGSRLAFDALLSGVPEGDRQGILIAVALLSAGESPSIKRTPRSTATPRERATPRRETQIYSRRGIGASEGEPIVPMVRGNEANDARARALVDLFMSAGRPLTADDVRGMVPDAALGWGTLWRSGGSIGAALARIGYVARYRHPGGRLAELRFERIEPVVETAPPVAV